MDEEVIALGAEALITRIKLLSLDILVKRRIRKKYRIKALDIRLRRERTIREARIITDCRKLGVPAPAIIDVDVDRSVIWMEFIKGSKLKDKMNELTDNEIARIAHSLGIYVGILHSNGIVHGDLTTSNVIITDNNQIYLIDFGLSAYSNDIENMGVDIHLFMRAIESTHYDKRKLILDNFMKGYTRIMGDKARTVFEKVREIRSRGRYVKERTIRSS